MDMIKKGTVKRYITEIKVENYEISMAIQECLTSKGYDLVLKPIPDRAHPCEIIGDRIEIYKNESK